MNGRSVAPLLVLTLLLGAATPAAQPDELVATLPSTQAPEQLDDGWAVATPSEVGIDPLALDSMTATIRSGQPFRNVHAVLIVRDDRLVYEQYFAGEDRRWVGREIEAVSLTFDRDTLHDTRSVGKSITSAVVGIAIADGAIPSVDASLADYFPELDEALTIEKRRITIRDALTMSAGLYWNEADVPYTDPTNDEERMSAREDPAAVVLTRELVEEPGARWYYNGGLPLLLGMAVARATGQSFGEFTRQRLFEPLGIEHVEWGGPRAWSGIPELSWEGSEPWAVSANPVGNLWIRPRDLAKFGSLYLNAGEWNGRQVLPAEWVEESTRRHIEVDADDPWGEMGYGYFWWHLRVPSPTGDLDVHSAIGNGEQRIFVIPALDLLVVHMAGRYNEAGAAFQAERLLTSHILPAMLPDESE